MSDLKPPARFHSTLGDWVVITDAWASAGGSLSEAVMVDTVKDERHKLILAESDDAGLTVRWFRRINAMHYVAIPIRYTEETLSGNEDKLEFSAAIGLAKADLIMATAFWPRYQLEAEWLSDADLAIIKSWHSKADDLDQETLEQRRIQKFGTSDMLYG